MMSSWLRKIQITVVLLGTFLLAACSSVDLPNLGKYMWSDPQLQTISLRATKDVNAGYPIAVDVLLITDQKAYDTLSNLRSTEWFTGKVDYQRQYQKKISLMSWELVPGQKMDGVSLLSPSDTVVGALIFADYIGERSYRAAVTKQKRVLVQLGKDDFQVLPYDDKLTSEKAFEHAN